MYFPSFRRHPHGRKSQKLPAFLENPMQAESDGSHPGNNTIKNNKTYADKFIQDSPSNAFQESETSGIQTTTNETNPTKYT